MNHIINEEFMNESNLLLFQCLCWYLGSCRNDDVYHGDYQLLT
jgi:hypothetical protein